MLWRQEPFPSFALNGMLGFGVCSSAFLYGLGVCRGGNSGRLSVAAEFPRISFKSDISGLNYYSKLQIAGPKNKVKNKSQ